MTKEDAITLFGFLVAREAEKNFNGTCGKNFWRDLCDIEQLEHLDKAKQAVQNFKNDFAKIEDWEGGFRTGEKVVHNDRLCYIADTPKHFTTKGCVPIVYYDNSYCVLDVPASELKRLN